MKNAVLVGFTRTPFHFARKGALADVRPDDMAGLVAGEITARTGIDPLDIDDVLFGCAYPEASQGNNIARLAVLLARLPISLPGMTVNCFCGSSMSAIHIAAGQIALGAGDVYLCGGVESMTQVPQGGFNFSPNPRFRFGGASDAEIDIEAYIAMGETAENVAAKFNVSRADQEAFAYRSQMKAAQAQAEGRLADEIVPVTKIDGTFISVDGCLRPGTTLEGLAKLKPAFRPDGLVTAGTSSPLTDGAAATMVCSEKYAKSHGLDILARVRAVAATGCAPELMGIGPIEASRKALALADLTMADMDVIELNEAFASQALACIRELGMDEDKVNIDGGGTAIGHPLGATGARITAKAAQIMKRQGAAFALATMCIGGGQGVATVLEAL